MTVEELVNTNKAIVHLFAKRYCKAGSMVGLEYDDLVGAGMLGLVKAAQRFDASKGVKFATFATPYVSGIVRQSLRDFNGIIPVSRSHFENGNLPPVVESTDSEDWVEPVGSFGFESNTLKRIQLDDALSRLLPRDRDIVRAYANGYTFSDIARMTGFCSVYISVRIKKALAKLRDMPELKDLEAA